MDNALSVAYLMALMLVWYENKNIVLSRTELPNVMWWGGPPTARLVLFTGRVIVLVLTLIGIWVFYNFFTALIYYCFHWVVQRATFFYYFHRQAKKIAQKYGCDYSVAENIIREHMRR